MRCAHRGVAADRPQWGAAVRRATGHGRSAGAFFDRGLAASSDAESGLAIDGRTEMPSHRGRMCQTR
ncbi:hypothetical protein BUH_1045 [Burkholderia pseudomallei Pakistan 9]|nr:hypothetical protein BUH_1045 [Burkholderia pseudomallei Pakistan 9]